MQKLAIEGLAALRTAGPGGSVALALADVVDKRENALLARRAAAHALGALAYTDSSGAPIAGLTPLQLVTPLAKLVRDSYLEHGTRAAPSSGGATRPTAYGGMPGTYDSETSSGYGSPTMRQDPEKARAEQFRRLYKTDLGAVIEALGRIDPRNAQNCAACCGLPSRRRMPRTTRWSRP